MSEQSFSLIPFPDSHLPVIAITGRISLQNTLLTVHYSLTGNMNEVLLPPNSQNPSRKDELWRATCFEIFLGMQDQPSYWEFNLSPSGDWNVYRMDAYRRIGFREEPGISHLPFTCKNDLEKLSLDVSVDLSPIVPPGQELQIGITTMIQSKAGAESYWALVHPASHADFHLRESFILRLATQAHPSEQIFPAG